MKCIASKVVDEEGADQGYFPGPDKFLFISDIPGQEEAEKQEFDLEVLTLNVLSSSWFLGAYLCQQKDLEAWIKPQLEAWAHRVIVLGPGAAAAPINLETGPSSILTCRMYTGMSRRSFELTFSPPQWLGSRPR